MGEFIITYYENVFKVYDMYWDNNPIGVAHRICLN